MKPKDPIAAILAAANSPEDPKKLTAAFQVIASELRQIKIKIQQIESRLSGIQRKS